jgi:glyoxylase-like metal-dependent hydrolase (beta-lactamase superfamily II)
MFKQMFDAESSTLTYFIVDEGSREAVLIDPVASHIEDYIALISELECQLKYSLETHVHADHITASGMLRERLNVKTGVSELCGAATADLQLNDGDVLCFGSQQLQVITTPGHTAGSVSFLWKDRIFTGDALLINGCGRTDFQGGSASMLFDSITDKIFVLPDETLVYPAHDYNGRRVSCVAQEKVTNLRVTGKSKAEFIALMNSLNLPKPKLIDVAVPANRMCGVPEPEVVQG